MARGRGRSACSALLPPDIDLTGLTLAPELELSSSYEIRLPLLWIGVLAGRIKASLAASTGVDSADEVIKYLLVGADVVMTTSSLLRHGIGHTKELLEGLEAWLGARHLESVARSGDECPTVAPPTRRPLSVPTTSGRCRRIRNRRRQRVPSRRGRVDEKGVDRSAQRGRPDLARRRHTRMNGSSHQIEWK
jgi:hypothetical protein